MTTFTNPILPGFHPDPSICRVGADSPSAGESSADYYLVNSTFGYFPGVPIFHSRDLVNWQQIGYCLTRYSQLPLEGVPAESGGIYAPTLRYHNGTFFMVTTNVSHGGHFYVTATDPAGPWSEPIWVRDHGYIDPSLFFDDDGTVYFTSCYSGGIIQSVIDIETGELVSEPRRVWTRGVSRDAEGPHLYKINGWYYLMVAEGGTDYTHLEAIGRSRSPWGPFDLCPHNPILTRRGEPWGLQCTGHADMLQAHDGTWWIVFLGVRPIGYPPCHHLGRETYLAPVNWVNDWPVVGGNGIPELEYPRPALPPSPFPTPPTRDDFDVPILALPWNFIRNPLAGSWSLSERPGWLRLYGQPTGLDDLAPIAFVGRRQCHFDCEADARVDFDPLDEGAEAGLTAYMIHRHHYEIAITCLNGQRRVIVRRRIGSLQAVVAQQALGPGPVILRVRATKDKYQFGISSSQTTTEWLAEGETRYLSTEVASGFTGVYLGMYTSGNGQPCLSPADFDWFDYSQA
jgi:alpha-N-arabinofuranosidase